MRGPVRRPLALLLLLALPAMGNEVSVRASGGLVDVVATAAPLQEVLAQLSRQTGMKVVYDGAAPRVPLTVTLPQRTPIEAVLALFEGLGLNYALKMDASGARIDTLIVSGLAVAGVPGRAPAQAGQSPQLPILRPPAPPPDEAPAEEEQEQESEDQTAQQAPQPQATPFTFSDPIPGPGQPGSPFGSGQVAPLVLPTPPPAPAQGLPVVPAVPAPNPTPSPSAFR